MINGQPVLDLLESVVNFENPCNFFLLLGLTPKPTDNGVGLTNYAQIFYQCLSPEEMELTNLKIKIDPECPFHPSHLLAFQYTSIAPSVVHNYEQMQCQVDVELDVHNSGIPFKRSFIDERVSKFNSLIAAEGAMGAGKKKSVIL